MQSQDESLPLLPTGALLNKKQAAARLGVSEKSINRYVKQGLLKPFKNKLTGKLLYDEDVILALMGGRTQQDRLVVLYCRTTTVPGSNANGAKARLQAQVDRTTEYCSRAGIRVDRIIAELGHANSVKDRPGIQEIMELVLQKKVSMIVSETPDRLARWFATEMLEQFFAYHGVEWHVISRSWQTEEYREEAKDDLAVMMLDAKRLMSSETLPGRGLRSPAQDKDEK